MRKNICNEKIPSNIKQFASLGVLSDRQRADIDFKDIDKTRPKMVPLTNDFIDRRGSFNIALDFYIW